MKEHKLRWQLAKIIGSDQEPRRHQDRAQELYFTIGTGACDYETIQRFIDYRESPASRKGMDY